MSQAGEIDVIGTHPEIPTEFVADVGTAVPIANTIEILGTTIAAGSIPVHTVASGNTLTVQVQRTQEIVASDATKVGLAAFDSSVFDVDSNGFVTLSGSVGSTNIDVDAHTAPGTDPVVPNASIITMTGAQVATGVIGTNVIRTNSIAANTVTIEIQRSTAVAATDITKNGVSHFNSTEFTVDGNGFVSLIGGGVAIDSIGTQTGTNPIAPTSAGLVTINGAVVAAGTNPVRSDGTGANTMAIEVQISQALAATDATKIGLSNFDSAAFDVDANGFVQLNGGGIASTSFDVQANTAPGTDPVVPSAAGVVIVNGAAVVNHSVVLETRSRAVNAYNLEIQYATTAAATNATKSGVAHFDSAAFSVDANGFVSLAGGGLAIDSIHPDSGTDPVVPNGAGLVNIIGSGSTTTVGSLNTLTIQLTGLTNHAVLVGAGTTTITKVGPTATTGQVLQSAGLSADPAFSTATYPLTTTINQILYSIAANTITGLATANRGVLTTTSAGVPVITALATDGQLIIGSTAGAPAAASITSSDSSITITPGSNSISLTVTGGTSVGKTITGNTGGALSPTAGNWNIVGTGSTTAAGSGSTLTVQLTGLTNHALQVGAGTATLTQLASGTTGQILQTNTGADPTWSTATYPSTATSTGTILRANGTNWVATTATYPTTTTANQILYSSATNVIGEITTANNSILSTNGSGVPSLGTSLSNDYTFTSSTAAATRTLTVSNTDNTSGSSTAIILAKTGGASSGDAVHQSSTTTTTWTWGIDNSVTSPTADPFVIAQGTTLGTNNIMSAATSGEINYPLQPCFSAKANAQTNVTGDNTTYTATFVNEIFDQNNDFDATSTFTSPVTGRYSLHTTLQMGGLTAAMTTISVQIVTSNRTYSSNPGSATQRDSNNNLSYCFSVIADMDAADICTITFTATGGTKVAAVQTDSFFMGTLTA